jgi:hypothetical protein
MKYFTTLLLSCASALAQFTIPAPELIGLPDPIVKDITITPGSAQVFSVTDDTTLVAVPVILTNGQLQAHYTWPNATTLWVCEATQDQQSPTNWLVLPELAYMHPHRDYRITRPGPNPWAGPRLVQLSSDASTNWTLRLRKVGTAPGPY